MTCRAIMLVMFCIACGLLAAADTAAADEPAPKLESLRFVGDGVLPIDLDGYGIATAADFAASEADYLKNPHIAADLPEYYRKHGLPVAYRRAVRPQVEGIALANGLKDKEFRVEGKCQFDLNGRRCSVTFSGAGKLETDRLVFQAAADVPLPDEVGHVPRLEITWTVFAGERRFDAGRTANPLYITLGDPVAPDTILYARSPHTALHLSCTAAAGARDKETVLREVWKKFQSRRVERVRDSRLLIYYGGYYGGQTNAGHSEVLGFLMCGYGQCQTWSALLAYSLAAHGINSKSSLIAFGVKHQIAIHGWRYIDGTQFIMSGKDGICQTTARGDDVQEVALGRGLPDTICNMANPGSEEMRFIASGFRLPYQRCFAVSDPKAVELAGDDVLQLFIGRYYVLNGSDGITQTKPGKGRQETDNTADRYPATARLMSYGKVETQNDDWVMHDAMIRTGLDGICQTNLKQGRQLIQPGMGLPNCLAISPGPNGQLDTKPEGDDTIVDISSLLKSLPADYKYITGINAIPPIKTPAQGNEFSPPLFPNHTVLVVGGQWYDPSYGTGPFPDTIALENASLSGITLALKGNGEKLLSVDDIPNLPTNWWEFFQVRKSAVTVHKKLAEARKSGDIPSARAPSTRKK